jgi:hypothetical protein
MSRTMDWIFLIYNIILTAIGIAGIVMAIIELRK